MVLVYGLPLIVRIARAANIPLPAADAAARAHAPTSASRRRRSASAGTSIAGAMAAMAADPRRSTRAARRRAWRRFAWIRSAYDPALRALAGPHHGLPAPWTTDRPAASATALPAPPPPARRLVATCRRVPRPADAATGG